MFSKVKLSENVDTLLLTPSVFSNFTSILENSDIVSFISFSFTWPLQKTKVLIKIYYKLFNIALLQ